MLRRFSDRALEIIVSYSGDKNGLKNRISTRRKWWWLALDYSRI